MTPSFALNMTPLQVFIGFSDTRGHGFLTDAQNGDKAQMLTDMVQNSGGRRLAGQLSLPQGCVLPL